MIPPTSPLDDVLSQTFETIVNRQAAALARRQQIHDAFLRVALTGGGLARLSGELAEILPGADVVICDPAGYPLAATTRSGAQGRTFRAEYLPDGSGRVNTAWLVAGVHQDAETGDALGGRGHPGRRDAARVGARGRRRAGPARGGRGGGRAGGAGRRAGDHP